MALAAARVVLPAVVRPARRRPLETGVTAASGRMVVRCASRLAPAAGAARDPRSPGRGLRTVLPRQGVAGAPTPAARPRARRVRIRLPDRDCSRVCGPDDPLPD